MNILLIIIILVFSVNTMNAQLQGQAKIDSLLKELPKMKKDTNAVNLLSTLSKDLYSSNPDKGIEYGLQGVKLAKIIDWKKGEANCYNSLGVNNAVKSYVPKALEYFHKALKINEKLGNKYGIAINLGNIGLIYSNQSDYPKALEYYHKALKINEELGNKSNIAINLGNIGVIYDSQSNSPKALEYYHKALKIDEEFGNKSGVAGNLGNIGNIYNRQSNYPKALEYHHKSLKIMEELGNKSGIASILVNIGLIYSRQSDYPKALEYFHKALKIFEEFENKYGLASCLGNMGELYFKLSQDSVLSNISEGTELVSLKKEINLNRSIEYSLQAIQLFEEIGELDYRSIAFKSLAEAYKQKGQFEKALEYQTKHMTLKYSVFNQENNEKLAKLAKEREKDLKQAEIEKQKALIIEQEKREQVLIYSAIIVFLLIIIILILVINSRKKSEKLLLNILPASIAKRLKAKEENIADDFETATTIFIDLVGFTSFAKDKKASEVVELLNNIFHRFDSLANKHRLEKIKTMGDGYLAVAGVPEPDTNHCQKAINFALDIYNELKKFNKEMGLDINARIGLETGPLVAGVIGSSKFIYDIWGDSVNTASRMESTGTPGKIQITENVKTELEKHKTNFQFEKREPFEVKGKGLMQTYYLE